MTNFEKIATSSNIKRILLLGSVYSFFELIGLILSTLGYFESDIRLYVSIIVIFHLIYLPVLYFFAYRKKTANDNFLKSITRIYFPVIIAWGSLFNGLIYLEQGDISIYAMVIFICAALFIFNPLYTKLIYSGAFVFFSLIIFGFLDKGSKTNELLFKSLIVTILAYMIASTNFKIRFKLHCTNEELVYANTVLQEQVVRDSLTGLYNNGYVFDYLDNAIKDIEKSHQKLSLIMIDIDDFKKINDNYGHLEGDLVIQGMANLLEGLLDEKDIAARYGGEEFLIV